MTDRTRQGMIDSAIRAAERLGVSVVILAAVLWMAREAATTLHSTVVVPVVKSHAEFLESTRDTLSEIGKTQMRQAMTLEEIAEGQNEIWSAGDRFRRAEAGGVAAR